MSLLNEIEKNTDNDGNPANALFQILDTNGNGTGTIEQAADFTTPDEFYIQPPDGVTYRLKRLNVYVEAANFDRADRYGSVAALTNGIQIFVESGGSTTLDLTAQQTIKKSYQWGLLAGSDVPTQGGVGFDALNIRWTFAKGCKNFILNGSTNDRFVMKLSDNLGATITSQLAMIQGCIL
jgi:hypothetical protein